MAVLDLRAHPGCPGDADTLARAFFGVRLLLSHAHFCMQIGGMHKVHGMELCSANPLTYDVALLGRFRKTRRSQNTSEMDFKRRLTREMRHALTEHSSR